MEVPNSEQKLAHVLRMVESEVEEMRKSVRQGTVEAESSQVVSATEVFSELRVRNAAAAR